MYVDIKGRQICVKRWKVALEIYDFMPHSHANNRNLLTFIAKMCHYIFYYTFFPFPKSFFWDAGRWTINYDQFFLWCNCWKKYKKL